MANEYLWIDKDKKNFNFWKMAKEILAEQEKKIELLQNLPMQGTIKVRKPEAYKKRVEE